VSWWAVQDSNL